MAAKPTDGIQAEQASPIGGQYHSIAELMAMDEAELQALWDEIPPERQKYYESAYETALASLGPGDVTDDAAMGIIEQVLAHYDSGQVPIPTGKRWVQVPSWVREAIEKGEDVTRVVEPVKKERTGPSTPVIIGAFVVTFVFVCILIMLIQRAVGGGGGDELSDEDSTATAVALAELEAEQTPTPTPLGIDDADRIIRGGEDFTDYYPVLLEIRRRVDTASTVFVVQQKTIEIAEWEYDERNMDVASWIAGLLVRPVLGIPYTPENAALLNGLIEGDTLMLHMSTGTILRFDVKERARVSQQDTSIFRQFSPGIVLVLLGEQEIGDRLVIFGEYPPEQELLRDDVALNLGNATSVFRIGDVAELSEVKASVKVIESYTSLGAGSAELPETLAFLFVDLEIIASDQPVDANRLQFDLIDTTGARFAPVSFDPALANYSSVIGQVVQPGSTFRGTLGYYVPRTIASPATLTIRPGPTVPPTTYLLTFDPPHQLTPKPLEVVISEILISEASGENPGIPSELIINARIFNPNSKAAGMNPDDIYAIFALADPGRGVFPVGAQILATSFNGSPPVRINIPAEQAVDLEIRFTWDGSPYVGIYIAGYKYIAQLQ